MNLSDRHPYLPLILVCAWLLFCITVGITAPFIFAYLGQLGQP